jgi:hypothetical protein
VEVYKVFKGNSVTDKVEVITPGGIVGGKAITAEPALKLSKGQTGIFFTSANPAALPVEGNLVKPVAGPQSFIKYDLVENNASDVFTVYQDITGNLYKQITSLTKSNFQTIKPFDVIPAGQGSRATPVILDLDPLTVSAGTSSILTIFGSNFGSTQGNGFVSFKNSDNNGTNYVDITEPLYYVSWADNMIQVIVPGDVMGSSVGTGTVRVTNNNMEYGTSSITLTVSFNRYEITAASAIEETILYNDNGSGGYTYVPQTEVAAIPAATAAIGRALDTWTCATYVNWNLSSTPTATDVVASDGINVIRFDNGTELGSGILGMGSTYWAYTWGPTESYWRVTELDITMDDGTNWNYGPGNPTAAQYDFESVMLHELGHHHQFNHVINTSSPMHYAIANGTMKRWLLPTDESGGDLVINSSITAANDAGISPMTPYNNNPSCIPTGLDNSSNRPSAQVFPNPATDFIKVTFNKNAKVEVFNLLGESCDITVAGDNLIDVSQLKRGIYVLKITDGFMSQAYRFSVSK